MTVRTRDALRPWSLVAPCLVLACVAAPSRTVPEAPNTPRPTVTVSPPSVTLAPRETATFSAAVTGVTAPTVVWSVQQGATGGTITRDGVYTAPDATGAFTVLATESSSGVSGQAAVTVQGGAWRLLPVSRARVYPRAGQAAALVGGTIQASNDSPTNGFTVLASIASAPAADAWTELVFTNAVAYRYVKYYGAPGSYGQIAELELYSGTTRLTGAGFGTAGSRSGNPWQNALDGATGTFFDAATPSDAYVGLDLAAGHVVATPTLSASGTSPVTVTLACATAGATIRYTTDGTDPLTSRTVVTYSTPFTITANTTFRAYATAPNLYRSDTLTQFVPVGAASGVTSIHLGNSLTDTTNDRLALAAAAGGYTLSYNRYTVAGIGTWIYKDQATGGGDCCANIVTWMQAHAPIDHLSMQPFENMPCSPDGYAGSCPVASGGTCASNRSDAVNMEEAWADAHANNPNVQVWVFQNWPKTPTEGFTASCMSGGSAWHRWGTAWGAATNPPSSWSTTVSTWEQAADHYVIWDEAVRTALIAAHPTWRTPYIVPGALLIKNIKASVEAGTFPGVATNAFWSTFFSNGGTDNHATEIGRYAVSLLWYACMFQQDPRALPDTNLGMPATLTAAQAAAIQQLVYDTVSGYPLSGYAR
jgi:hypothetical protein